jgi:hypothetical protein
VPDAPCCTRCRLTLGGGERAVEVQILAVGLTLPVLLDRVYVACLRAMASTTADKHVSQDRRLADAAWWSWLQEGPGTDWGGSTTCRALQAA